MKDTKKYDTEGCATIAGDTIGPDIMFSHGWQRSEENQRLVNGFAEALERHCSPLEDQLHSLMEYAGHKAGCRYLTSPVDVVGGYDPPSPCTCGLDELLTRLSR